LVAGNVCTAAYPPPLGFRAWAFGGGLAAVLCSLMPFFYFFLFFFVVVITVFFIFCNRKNGSFIDVGFYTPPAVFLPILTTFC
jgi:hypothetical protein